MPTKGFYFTRLEARGRNKTTAILELSNGLNVISGASDTGKSYLVHCLNFMTGSKKPPKAITESAGYETLWLEITTWADEVYTLERSLRGKDFRLYRCALEEVTESQDSEVIKESRGQGETLSISEFLLDLCGATGIKVRTNAKGKTRSVSFRDYTHLSIITEEQIYTEGTPVRPTQQYVNNTVEESFFKYLLTGVDDSSVIVSPAGDASAAYRQAKLDGLKDFLDKVEATLNSLTSDPGEVQTQLRKLNESVEQATTAIAVDRDRLGLEQQRQRELWEEVQQSTTRAEVLARLVDRFKLLERHYDSDIQRLGAVSEAGGYISQMPKVPCPVCGTQDPWGSDEDLGQVKRACEQEVRRIGTLQADLRGTLQDIENEITSLQRNAQRSQRSYDQVTQQIQTELLPANQTSRGELATLLDTRAKLDRAGALVEQIQLLKQEMADLEEIQSRPKPVSRSDEQGVQAAKTSETEEFCKVVEKILEDWNFPDKGRVTFSESSQDLVINGKDRASHGKGIRALSYAAFVVGLLRYCENIDRPHPGFVVLDSPLVAYREPDSMQSVAKAGVKDSFYRDLAKHAESSQVIIFENEEPPTDLTKGIAYTHFTGDKKGVGRSGFFPTGGQRESDNGGALNGSDSTTGS